MAHSVLTRSFLGALSRLGGKARQRDIIAELTTTRSVTYRRTSIGRIAKACAERGEIVIPSTGWYYLPDVWERDHNAQALVRTGHGITVRAAIMDCLRRCGGVAPTWKIHRESTTLDGKLFNETTIRITLAYLAAEGALIRVALGKYALPKYAATH